MHDSTALAQSDNARQYSSSTAPCVACAAADVLSASLTRVLSVPMLQASYMTQLETVAWLRLIAAHCTGKQQNIVARL